MPRTCTICRHPQRESIDKALLSGEPHRSIAKRASISAAALFRHQAHISPTLAKATQAAEIARADSLLEQLRGLAAEARALKRKAEDTNDYRTALAAIKELCRIIELIAKLTGELNEQHQTNILNVQLDPETAKRLAETYLARHGQLTLEEEDH